MSMSKGQRMQKCSFSKGGQGCRIQNAGYSTVLGR